MKIKTVFLLAFLPVLILAQEPRSFVCGVEGELGQLLQEQFRATRDQFYREPSIAFRDVQYVPIVFHIVRRTDKTGGADVADILDQLCDLNRDFAPMNMQFYLKDGTFNYINNSAVYSNHVNTINSIMSLEKDNKALNVFLVENATPPSSTGPGITLGYYYPVGGKDWVVIRDKEMESRNTTLSHELGHYFSLPHPHFGWESDPWTVEKYGSKPAPVNSPLGQPTEKANGSNCDISGDEVCDTPPDYNGFGWPDCTYTLAARDPDSVVINPDEELIMSYFLNCRRENYKFSPMQQEMMLTNLASNQRSSIRGTTPDNTTVLPANTRLVAPTAGQTLTVYDRVNMDWVPVEGATFYLVEVDGLPTFSSLGKRSFIVEATGNSLVLDYLSPDKLYFWRVRPFNSLSTCLPFTGFQSFRTGLLTSVQNHIPGVNDWTLGPNPIGSGEQVFLSLQSDGSFDGQVTWMDVQGRLLGSPTPVRITSGKNQLSLQLPQTGKGVCFFVLQSDKGRISRKVVILN